MSDSQQPRPCPSCGRTSDHLGCTCQTCCPASAMTTNADPQEPRTGGVPFISYRVRHDGPLRLVEWDAELNRPEQHTHTVFTRAEAEALIDPNDPAMREMLAGVIDRVRQGPSSDIADAVLAALRSKP